ncbi:MAG: type II toxin-antitoxin system RelE/ParE family toxin [Candidatus Cloacimonetes bacterium]|nr:type II toxin-antitoxin system RelE/ParE family toxin [Candidatus Cloacimonadota bacterium]
MFKIKWGEKALSYLDNLGFLLSKRIIKNIDNLKENPFSKNIKRLKGMDVYRLRIGDYRVLFEIDKDLIKILKIGHRKNIYKKIK